jgi:hypothetical protein
MVCDKTDTYAEAACIMAFFVGPALFWFIVVLSARIGRRK